MYYVMVAVETVLGYCWTYLNDEDHNRKEFDQYGAAEEISRITSPAVTLFHGRIVRKNYLARANSLSPPRLQINYICPCCDAWLSCDCCICTRCQSLSSHDDHCHRCDRCDLHCECVQPAATFAERPLVFHKGKKCDEAPILRMTSAEIEVAVAEPGEKIDQACEDWSCSVVIDGSLPEEGFEINTSPASGDKLRNQIRHITDALAAQNAKVNIKCGLHVHVDARDLTYWDIRKLILLYSKIEDALFSVIPRKRRQSDYCIPCGKKYLRGMDKVKDTRKTIVEHVYRRSDKYVKDLKNQKYVDARYNALNLHSWFHRGTVECRLAAGTVDFEKIFNWSVLWAAIVDCANRVPEKTIRDLNGDGFDTLLSIAPTRRIKAWLIHRRDKFEE